MSKFEIEDTDLAGLKLIQRKPIEDVRGFFCRFFCAEEFSGLGLKKPVAQINHVYTRKAGTVRGLHFQYPPAAEAKVVSCLRGKILDVAVDLRHDSPTFLGWHAEVLSADNHRSLFIPEGFAQGYQTLTDDCELLYLHSERFCPEAVGSLNVLDPQIAIKWPMPITEISERDRKHPFVSKSFKGVML